MSVSAITWAFAQDVPRSSLKLLLVALADHAGAEGLIYPSISALCEKTSQNRKTVISGLSELQRMGLLADTCERRGRTEQIKVYSLPIPSAIFEKEYRKRNSSENGTVPFLPSNSTVFTRKEYQKRDTEPLREPIEEPKKEDKKEEGSQKRNPLELHENLPIHEWDEWLQFRRERKFPMSPLALKRHLSILSRYDTETQRQIIDTSINAGWSGIFPPKGQGKKARGEWE